LRVKSKKLKENSIKNNILFLEKDILENISKEYLEILEK
jgi:DNA-binding MarR family transcriptional regulator